ncbi:early nodulin-75-like [Ostrinia furnacalis]|uniref:early nodulin-75-like n=1 Tax=Ostrinia furnacalis TaxID=93504 RepID=UPI00103C6A95|nr:early nodulin-75-like [Ostrinia furnacalis]
MEVVRKVREVFFLSALSQTRPPEKPPREERPSEVRPHVEGQPEERPPGESPPENGPPGERPPEERPPGERPLVIPKEEHEHSVEKSDSDYDIFEGIKPELEVEDTNVFDGSLEDPFASIGPQVNNRLPAPRLR